MRTRLLDLRSLGNSRPKYGMNVCEYVEVTKKDNRENDGEKSDPEAKVIKNMECPGI